MEFKQPDLNYHPCYTVTIYPSTVVHYLQTWGSNDRSIRPERWLPQPTHCSTSTSTFTQPYRAHTSAENHAGFANHVSG